MTTLMNALQARIEAAVNRTGTYNEALQNLANLYGVPAGETGSRLIPVAQNFDPTINNATAAQNHLLYNSANVSGGIPAMGMDFTSGMLDSRVTFARASSATVTNSEGLIAYAPHNLLTYSQEFGNVVWTKISNGVGTIPTVTENAGTAPDGTQTADLVQLRLNGGTTTSDFSSIYQLANVTSGLSYSLSFWAKSSDSISSYLVQFRDDQSSTVATTVTVTGSWQRFTFSGTAVTTLLNFRWWLRGAQGTSNSADIYLWGAQLNIGALHPYYVSVATAYQAPRFDYDPVSLAAKGFLIEEQRTNLLINSGDLSSVATTGTAVRTPNQLIAPDGTLTGSIFTGNGVPAIATQTATATASTMTFSCYVKVGVSSSRSTYQFLMRNSTTATNFTISTFSVLDGSITGSGWSSASVGNNWYRLTYTNSVAQIINVGDLITCYFGAIGGITYTSADSWGVWGAQLEAGAFSTSYIPTVAAQVTRAADVASMTGTNFSSWYNATEGTFFVNFRTNWGSATTSPNSAFVLSGDATQRINYIGAGATSISSFDGTNIVPFAENVVGVNVRIATGLTASTNSIAAAFNGGAVATGTFTKTGLITQLQIGSGGLSNVINGHIRRIMYFNTRLTNAQLEAITA